MQASSSVERTGTWHTAGAGYIQSSVLPQPTPRGPYLRLPDSPDKNLTLESSNRRRRSTGTNMFTAALLVITEMSSGWEVTDFRVMASLLRVLSSHTSHEDEEPMIAWQSLAREQCVSRQAGRMFRGAGGVTL